jgi:hypothetical protein
MAAMTSDPMRRLPPELWSKVCAHLDLRDAGNLRLSCRTLDAMGARFVLRELTVYLDPDAFDRLRAVAADPLTARCIRSVNWAWCQTAQHPHTQHGKPGRCALASLLRALETSGTGLPSALGLDWESLDDLAWTTTRPALTPFFTALGSPNLQFCLCNILRRDPRAGPIGPDHSRSIDMHRYTQLLATAGALSSFLSSIPNLTTLAISFCYGLSASTPIGNLLLPNLEHVLGQGQDWPRLQSISLGGLSLHKALLMDFLGSHKATLRRVELFSVWLDADWPGTLQDMMGILALEETAVWTRIYCDRGQWHLGRPRGDGRLQHLTGEAVPGRRGERENLRLSGGIWSVVGSVLLPKGIWCRAGCRWFGVVIRVVCIRLGPLWVGEGERRRVQVHPTYWTRSGGVLLFLFPFALFFFAFHS